MLHCKENHSTGSGPDFLSRACTAVRCACLNPKAGGTPLQPAHMFMESKVLVAKKEHFKLCRVKGLGLN